ncbi:MAG: transcriptional regulator [Silvibacterium sp.]
MSPRKRSASIRLRAQAPIFAALGDEMRLSLLAKLGCGQRYSISQLTEGTPLTRQAVTKHLRILERVRVVRCVRSGRECLFELDPQPVQEICDSLSLISEQWDHALSRLKSFVETDRPK